MPYNSLNEFVEKLEQANELIRISSFVNPELEIAEITDRFSKQLGGGKALLFENTGLAFPVLTNTLGSYKRICLAFGMDKLDDFGRDLDILIKGVTSEKKSFFAKFNVLMSVSEVGSWMPKLVSGRGKCQEVVNITPDLSILPILKCWPADGGKFITLPLVHTKDPITGIRNVGMYRMQVLDNVTTGMHWHRHKTGARHYEEYKKLGLKMPVAIALGGDPIYTYVATAPLPNQIDEYILAGIIRKKKVELVKCITQDIEVPKDADIIIEGYVDTTEDLFWEGPFGDHTGFYSLEDWYPKFHVTCITHRRNAIYPATIVGIPPQEDAWIAKATERLFLVPMKLSLAPELIDIDLPTAGVAHNFAILKIEKRYPGQGLKVISSLWGAGQMMFNKVMLIVDEEVDIHDYNSLFRNVIGNLRISEDLLFGRGPLDVLDHSSNKFAFGSKLGIDATKKFPEEISSTCKTDSFVNTIDWASFLLKHPEIKGVNKTLLDQHIPVFLFTVKDEFKKEVCSISEQISREAELIGVKLIACFDSVIDISDLYVICWQILSNIDPERDCKIIFRDGNLAGSLCVDATSKTFEYHCFTRPWPNIVVSDQETINNVDSKWDSYFSEKFIKSPSLNYQALSKGNGAIASKNLEHKG